MVEGLHFESSSFKLDLSAGHDNCCRFFDCDFNMRYSAKKYDLLSRLVISKWW